jgi:murein DD-endopeptidase MepM/ murein hydrolase activator NlpD
VSPYNSNGFNKSQHAPSANPLPIGSSRNLISRTVTAAESIGPEPPRFAPQALLQALLDIDEVSLGGQAKPGKRGPHKKPAAPASKYDCGQGAELLLSAPESSQGGLLLAELRSPKPVTQIKANWDEKEAPFWQEAAPAPNNRNVHRALLGIDLEKPAGDYEFAVSGKSEGGDPIACTAAITVKAGRFATESLKVAPNFVEPNPEQLVRAEIERKRLREIFATVTPDKLWQGPFRVPLDGVQTGGNFGKRRVLNGQPGSPHSGVDFPAPTGTPVHAAQRGRVVLAEPLYFSGNTVLVDHGLGVYTLYGHFSEIAVKPGDLVETGALLGKVGATGRVTGPHLHWGLTVNRARVDALRVVALGKAAE